MERIFHGHGDKFSWASKYFSMGMEIYNDGQRDFSVAQWEILLTAVGIPEVLDWEKKMP